MTGRRRRTLPWLALGLGSGLAAAALGLVHDGRGMAGIALGAILAARAAFVFFFPAYAGGALARLFPFPLLAAVARYGREAGLAFAGALFVHLAMVLWLFEVSARPPVGDTVIATFGLGAAWAFALTLFSLEPFGAVFASRAGRALRSLGMSYIAALFIYDFVILPLEIGVRRVSHPLQYAPFVLLSLAGPLIRLAAWLRHGRPFTRYSPHPR